MTPDNVTGPPTADPLEAVPNLYAAAPVGLCVFDSDLRWVEINDWLAKINGLPVAEHVGRTIQEVLPAVAAIVVPQLREVIETGVPKIGGSTRAETPAHPGVEHYYRHNFVAIDTEERGIVGLSVMVEDLGPCDGEEPTAESQRPLTSRETEVLRQIGLGATSRQIAERLGVSVRTVDAHRRGLTLKLSISGSAQLAAFAKRSGLVSGD